MISISGRAQFDSRMVHNVICFLILNLVLISFGSATSRRDNPNLRYVKAVATDTTAIARAYLFDVPLDSPMNCRVEKDLPVFVKVARELNGRIDLTSVSAGADTFERTHGEKNPVDSVAAIDGNYASLGQNSKLLGSCDRAVGRTHHGSALNHDTRIFKESPTSNPLSFVWEHLETKK
jgi:hypothetical protein